MSKQERWVQKQWLDPHITYHIGQGACTACGTYYAVNPATHRHDIMTCLACGTEQCMSTNNRCCVCLIGICVQQGFQPRTTCGYKHCTQPAIARCGGLAGVCCKEHAERATAHGCGPTRRTVATIIAADLAERTKTHTLR